MTCTKTISDPRWCQEGKPWDQLLLASEVVKLGRELFWLALKILSCLFSQHRFFSGFGFKIDDQTGFSVGIALRSTFSHSYFKVTALSGLLNRSQCASNRFTNSSSWNGRIFKICTSMRLLVTDTRTSHKRTLVELLDMVFCFAPQHLWFFLLEAAGEKKIGLPWHPKKSNWLPARSLKCTILYS